jgi:hypothetical protein
LFPCFVIATKLLEKIINFRLGTVTVLVKKDSVLAGRKRVFSLLRAKIQNSVERRDELPEAACRGNLQTAFTS